MAISNYLGNMFLNSVFTGTPFTVPTLVYVALFTGNPASGGLEVTGGSYARKQVTSTTATALSNTNTTALTYNNMPAATITYVAFYDALTAGNLLFYQTISTQTTNNGDTVAIPVNGITATES